MNIPLTALNIPGLLDHLDGASPEESLKLLQALISVDNPHGADIAGSIVFHERQRPNSESISAKLRDLRQAIAYRLATRT